MNPLLLLLVTVALLQAKSGAQSVNGVITESECADANHALMRMGDTDAECAKACVESHGATWLLFDGKMAWALSDQKAPAEFAGKRVVVTGAVDTKAKRITVQSIAPAK